MGTETTKRSTSIARFLKAANFLESFRNIYFAPPIEKTSFFCQTLETLTRLIYVMTSRNPHHAASELVRRAKNGDTRAFNELVARYRDRIFALCLHLNGNESDADDVTQETFMRAYNVLDRFEGRSEFFTWVYRIAINLSLNHRRARKRRRADNIEDPRLARALEADAKNDPAKQAELRETYGRLLHALDKLPATMKATVVLVTLQGLSHAEAAIVLKCSEGTIAWRIHRARKELKQALDNEEVIFDITKDVLSDDLLSVLKRWGLPKLSPYY